MFITADHRAETMELLLVMFDMIGYVHTLRTPEITLRGLQPPAMLLPAVQEARTVMERSRVTYEKPELLA